VSTVDAVAAAYRQCHPSDIFNRVPEQLNRRVRTTTSLDRHG
jgi:hypothetical protein